MRKYIYFMMILFLAYSVAEAEKYGIIAGDKVNLRQSPSIGSVSLDLLSEGSLVFDVEKTEKREQSGVEAYNWYKIKMNDGKAGFVYGKYIFDFSKSKITEKEFSDVIDIAFEPHFLKYKINGVKIDKIDGLFFLKSKVIDGDEYQSRLFIFNNSFGGLKKVIPDTFYGDNYFVTDSLVFIWGINSYITVYNRKEFVKSTDFHDSNTYYKVKEFYNVYVQHPNSDITKQKMSFNPQTKILDVKTQMKDSSIISEEMLKFNGDKFEPMK